VPKKTPFLNKLKHESSQILQHSDIHNKAEISVSTDARVSIIILRNVVYSGCRSSSLFKIDAFGDCFSLFYQVNEQKKRLLLFYFFFGPAKLS
jgi:hypothetical protein